MEFRVRGVLRRIDIAAPYTWSLDTTGIADGLAEITAASFDEAGNSRVFEHEHHGRQLTVTFVQDRGVGHRA